MSNRRKKNKRNTRRSNHRSLRKSRKQKFTISYAKTCVKNFSNYNITDTEYIVLSKGMKFVPQISNKHVYLKQSLMSSFNKLARNMRCKYELDDGHDYQIHPFYVHSDYTPPVASNAIENYIFKTKMEISDMTIRKFPHNMSKKEWKALKKLQQNKEIVIKSADKTKTIVIQNKSNYIEEGQRQLSEKYYTKIEHPTTENIQHSVLDLINKLFNQDLIDEMTYKYLTMNFKPTPGIIYFLPKIHKLPQNILDSENYNNTGLLIPSRPIVSQINSCTQRIGRLADIFLLPLVQQQYTYLKDTKDLINKIESLQFDTCEENDNIILATYDITSMYTNMTIEELLEAVRNTLENCPNINELNFKLPFIGITNVVDILRLQLQNNEFCFGKNVYKQTIGCSMGAVSSPEVSDIRAYQIIENILQKYPFKNQIKSHFRYRDDGLIIFECKSSSDELKLLFDIANKEHNLLKFTYNISKQKVDFLDTTLYKGKRYKKQGILDIKSFHKPTDSYAYLHRSSAHYEKVFKGILTGHIIREIKINSEPDNFTNEITQIKERFSKRGYKSKEINNAIKSTADITRDQILKGGRKRDKSRKPLVLITKYHKGLTKLPKLIRKHWHLIEKNEEAKSIFPKPPMIAFKRNKNLAEYLTSAKLQI